MMPSPIADPGTGNPTRANAVHIEAGAGVEVCIKSAGLELLQASA